MENWSSFMVCGGNIQFQVVSIASHVLDKDGRSYFVEPDVAWSEDAKVNFVQSDQFNDALKLTLTDFSTIENKLVGLLYSLLEIELPEAVLDEPHFTGLHEGEGVDRIVSKPVIENSAPKPTINFADELSK